MIPMLINILRRKTLAFDLTEEVLNMPMQALHEEVNKYMTLKHIVEHIPMSGILFHIIDNVSVLKTNIMIKIKTTIF